MISPQLSLIGFFIVAAYCAIFFGLALFGAHRYWLVSRYFRHPHRAAHDPPFPDDPPTVLIQLPVYNEIYVVDRLIAAAAAMDYPRDRFQIQILDDSTDRTSARIAELTNQYRAQGVRIDHLRRADRKGYKAGALAWGLDHSDAPFVAVFDADFIPPRDFLRRTVGHFDDPRVGMVQARWDHLNAEYSTLTRVQAQMLDGHFAMEHGSRHRSDCFFNFNGTAGLWRRRAIEDAGGWQADTLTEDLDLSYRAQLAGWKFVYRPDLSAAAELPVSIFAFKSQQHRWTRGSIQTARKLLGPIWRSRACRSCKLEATAHLLSNLTYILLVALAVLLLPVYFLRHQYGLHWLFWVDVPMLFFGTGALIYFYANAQRELGRSPWTAAARLPALMAVGVGMSVNNAWAVVEGLFAGSGEFVRTPKYRIEKAADAWRAKTYLPRRQKLIPRLEFAFFVYFLCTLVFCLSRGLWWALPFTLLFLAGFGYVSLQSFSHGRGAGVSPASRRTPAGRAAL